MIAIFLYFYLGVGILNATHALATGTLTIGRHRQGTPFVELAFYVLAWPIQVLFWTCVCFGAGLEWVFRKVAG